ncbi:MAG TPA: murein biosynthesis integral membrane protein MurJ [Candidatus Binatia bacterium]|nr:murein biosynthesis integral membrane protein MurJ [Candidatus Binatia bacterium]
MTEGQGATQARVVGAVGTIGLATLASRLLGYVRDMVVAGTFGAGPVTDAFFVAFRIPNLLRRLLAEGAISTALIPVFSEYLARGDRAAFVRMVRAVAGMGLVVLVAVSALGVLVASPLVIAMAPGWTADPPLIDLAVRLTRIMFPYLLLVGLAALATAALNAHHRFLTAAIGPAVLNVGIIACVWLLASRVDPPILALAAGVLVGGLGQFLVQVPEVARLGVPLWPSTDWKHPAVRRIVRLLAPATFGLAGVQLAVMINTLLASLLPAGTVSYLYYADRVMEFPLGVFGIALATAALPSMAAQAARGDHGALRATVGFALRLACFVAVPAAAGLLALGEPIVRLLFVRGEFGAVAALATTQALAGYAVGLPAFSATRIAAQTFYALGDTRTPVRLGLVALGVNVLLALVLMWPLRHAGLALASSLSAYVNAAALYWALRRRLGPLGGRELAGSLGRTLAASGAMLAWCLLLRPRGIEAWPLAGWTLAVVATGVLLYLVASRLLRSPEAEALLAPLARLGRRLPRARGE